MAISTRLIKRRIRTVGNTKKITKAMELVSAAKMRRAVAAMLAGRPYAEEAVLALNKIAEVVDLSAHPLLGGVGAGSEGGAKKVLAILMTSDRSLCGGFNSKLFAAAEQFVREYGSENVEFAVMGTKGQDFLRKRGRNVIAAWGAPSKQPKFSEIKPLADLAIGDFLSGKYSEVHVITTEYKSALIQNVKRQKLMPVKKIEKAKIAGEVLFEPDASTVLSAVLPRLVEAQVYHSLLESLASEHSARMLAMRSATDNAGEMIESLTLTFNQARQAGITREIAEISAGAAAIT